MKRFLSMLLALCMVMTILPVAVLAAGTEVASGTCGDNLTWKLDSEGTLTISGTGAMADYESTDIRPWEDYIDEIARVVVETGVMTIGTYAFRGAANISAVTLPEGLETIEKRAFNECPALTEVTIPASVTAVNDGAFSCCANLTDIWVNEGSESFVSDNGVLYNTDRSVLVQVPGATEGSFEIPSTVTEIGISAMSGCTFLTAVSIPDSVTAIGKYAFNECRNITELVIPESVTVIGLMAFYNCYALESINIPESVTALERYTFFSCTSLEEITIPASVTILNDNTFRRCSALKKVYFRGDAPEFEINIFNEVTTTVYYPADNATWTADVMQQYGGNVTWVPYTPGEELPGEEVAGDLDGDGVVSDTDVAELLWYVLFPTTDMDQNAADVDGDEDVDLDDVIYLLWYTLFPDDYPLQ